jgi:hypothetical protein
VFAAVCQFRLGLARADLDWSAPQIRTIPARVPRDTLAIQFGQSAGYHRLTQRNESARTPDMILPGIGASALHSAAGKAERE